MPISNGAMPVASALGIRSGATPCGHPHHNAHSQSEPSKPDISKWQAIGHFYLALTRNRDRRTQAMLSAQSWYSPGLRRSPSPPAPASLVYVSSVPGACSQTMLFKQLDLQDSDLMLLGPAPLISGTSALARPAFQ